jgi:hypothetical protein
MYVCLAVAVAVAGSHVQIDSEVMQVSLLGLYVCMYVCLVVAWINVALHVCMNTQIDSEHRLILSHACDLAWLGYMHVCMYACLWPEYMQDDVCVHICSR